MEHTNSLNVSFHTRDACLRPYIAFTNYGTGHAGSQAQAVDATLIQGERRVDDSATYPVAVVERLGTYGPAIADDDVCRPFGPLTRDHPMPPTPRPDDPPPPTVTVLRCEGAAGAGKLALRERRTLSHDRKTDHAEVSLSLHR